MSLSPSAQRAVEWLEQQLADLAGIRNATPRDPSFKNWRQATLTTLQRIWPGDQDRSERFRRIPFSPVDPRADARTVREWYSRGCQEATRVLNGFVEDVRQNGVPDQPAEAAVSDAGAGFEDDFPTVDLPAGDLSAVASEPVTAPHTLSEFVDDVPAAPPDGAPAPPTLPSGIPAINNPVAEVHAHELPHPRKGVGARLKDLLGFAQLSAKALAGFPREAAPGSSLPSLDAPVSTSLPSMDVVPLGGAVTNEQGVAPQSPASLPAPLAAEDVPHSPPADEPVPSAPPTLSVSLPEPGVAQAGASMSGLWPLPRTVEAPAPAVPVPPAIAPPAPVAPAPAVPVAPAAATAPPAPPEPMVHEPGKSVVMSRPTTLRSAIEKVSIESLLSDQFRGLAGESPAGPAPESPQDGADALEQMVNAMLSGATPGPATPAANELPAAGEPSAAGEPESPAMPLFEQVRTAPAPAAAAPSPESVAEAAAPAEAVVPEPATSGSDADPARLPATEIPVHETTDDDADTDEMIEAEAPPETPARPAARGSRLVQVPPRRRGARAEEPAPEDDSAVGKVDPDAFARAADDFMRSSPVLGATGRKVKRPNEDTGFNDPDAIAVASMMQELARLDVPSGRQPEVRARLLDLARRIEKGDLEWSSLRKAVWFAMEYPEIARRLMPVLLPWIDRAA